MRLNIEFSLQKKELPIDYRRGFISLFKAIIQNCNSLLFHKFYSGKTSKPFTFNIYFPDGVRKSTSNDFEVGYKVVFQVSSNNIDFISAISNGSRSIKDFQIFYNQITFERAIILPLKTIHSDKVQFRTVSPFLINTTENEKWYLVPGAKGFENAFETRLREQVKHWLGINEFSYEITPIDWKRYPITHYNQTMSGVKGEFILKAPKEIQQLIFDIGLGVRRSQGFGMLNIVKQL